MLGGRGVHHRLCTVAFRLLQSITLEIGDDPGTVDSIQHVDPSAPNAAVEVDRRFGLKERVSSALMLPDDARQTEIGQALINDASRRAEMIVVSERFPVTTGWKSLLPVLPVAADFTRPFQVPAAPRAPRRRSIYFPGSTIGNFDAGPAAELLANLAQVAEWSGALLIGLDLQKDPRIIEAAYNDAQGVTAAFNLNVLARMNRELGTEFDLSRFRHRAWYNREAGRIEMHLESTVRQSVRLNGHVLELAKGETICTEYSYKYDVEEFAHLAAHAGWRLERQWRDERDYFAVLYLTRA